ncbi:hypothetical protein [Kiloniella sp. b19]|uniref:hypothetical protein n=1 Tax=Kiloniella sp. GXU_MW_B19 TaxID=3141326 RepID=UPI0031D1C685
MSEPTNRDYSEEELEKLLPFYVAGSLSEQEHMAVEQALNEKPEWRDEIVVLERIRDEINERNESVQSPGELGLKRLQRELQSERRAGVSVPQPANDEPGRAASGSFVWRIVAMAACFVLVLQTAFFLPQSPFYRGDEARESLQTASRTGGALTAQGVLLQIAFQPTAEEEQIRTLLLSVEGQIVDGPTALGFYTVAIPKRDETVLEKILARKNLVETAYWHTINGE